MVTSVIKRNNVQIFGEGEKIIMFAHGFGCDQNMWRFITPAYEKNYKIILFDYVGCGKSDLSAYNEEKYGTLEGYACDIVDICKELNLTNVTFVGHSVSSMIGVLAYLKSPEAFEKLIFVCPSPCYINDAEYTGGFEKEDLEELLDVMDKNYLGWASFLAPVVMNNPDRPELTEELQNSFCSIEPRITKKFAQVTFFSDNRGDLDKVNIPALILQCNHDAIAPEEVGEYIHEKIKGSILIKMKATGHCPHMTSPQETIEKINNFLSQESITV